MRKVKNEVEIGDLDVDGLLALRVEIDRMIAEKRKDIERQLSRLGSTSDRRAAATGRRGASAASRLKGAKIAPKYRGPNGETWAGRGAQPRWMRDSGRPPEAFLIDKAA